MIRCAQKLCVRCFSGRGDYEELKRKELVGHEQKPGEPIAETKKRVYADLEEHDRLNAELMSTYSSFSLGGWMDIPPADVGTGGKIVFMFLVVGALKNEDWWQEWFDAADKKGYKDKYSIVYHRGSAWGQDGDTIADDFLARRGLPVLPATKTGWARNGLIRANLLMLRFALEAPDNKWFVLLSDSCMPLYSFPDLYSEISRQVQSRFHDFGECTLDVAMDRYIWQDGACTASTFAHKADQWAMWIRADAEWFVRQNHLVKLKPMSVFCDEPFFINMMDHDNRPYTNDMVTYNTWYHPRDIPCPCYKIQKWKKCLSSPHSFQKVSLRHVLRARRAGCWFMRKAIGDYPECVALELESSLKYALKQADEIQMADSVIISKPLTE